MKNEEELENPGLTFVNSIVKFNDVYIRLHRDWNLLKVHRN